MSTAGVTYTFVNGDANDGPQVSTNFTDLTTYINSNCIVKDGAVQMTGQLSLKSGTDPTADDHAARKKYVDDRVGRSTSYGTSSHTITAFDTFQTIDTLSIADPGKAVVVCAWGGLTQVGGNGNCLFSSRIGINMTGSTVDADFTWSIVNYHTIPSGEYVAFSPFVRLAGTPSGIIRIRLQHRQASAVSTFGQASEAAIMYDMFKAVGV